LTITGSSNTTGLTIALIKSDGTNLNTSNGSGGGNTDRNGNEITVDGSGHFYDTLSSTAPVLTVAGSGTATSPMTFAYTAPSTGSAAYTMKYTTYSIQTNFGCSNITDYGTNGTATASLVSEIDLPDWNATTNPNSRYTFNYESTPGHSGFVTGRLASVTLPTGGTISYHYTGGSSGNITCADGSTPGLQRVLSDGASWSATWTYARTPGTGAASTTTVTDAERDTLAPNGNDTVTQFQGIYETQLQIYQGLHTSGALLQTINTCYNANTSNCATTAITLPITQRNITTVLPNSQQSEHDDFWNTYGAPTETDDYDYGTAPHGSLLKKVLASYATLGNINAFRQTVTTQDGSGNPVSKVTYNYDETTPTTTSGTPQHFSVPAPWGNLTSTYTYTNSGGFLSDSRTYYDTGMFKTTTDVNGGITTYNYASGAASCYNAFPTSINEPISGLSTSATWNCTGGVQLTSVDENSQTTTTAYTDPYFWRPASVTDQTGAATYFCYAALSAGACPSTPNTTQVESYMNFNSGNSTVDSLTTLDGLGRLRVQQKRRGPASSSSNFDSVETDYDSLGRVSHVTLPYVGTAGQTNSSAAGTTTTYDAMNRPRTVSDSGGGTTSYNYGTANDTLVTRSPAPTGENTKVRQFESDALGRLTSVCEVTAGTTAWPGGTCAQNSSPQPTGYWTRYTYDPMGNLMTVTQNAQSTSNQQARTYVYDWMGRMTSETNPESGTKTYVYDSDSTMCGNGAYSSRGDLLKTTDAAGNCVMRYYDSLHRLTDVGNNNQSATNPCKRFRYDNSSGYVGSTKPAGLNNTLGRLIEAATDVCAGSNDAILTDEWFSYSQRGETSDVYESTPHSGAYYHSASTYWANRAPNQLTGNIGLPTTITRSPDGEGRTNSVSASSGQSPLISSTVYSPASFPTTINLGSGSGDADAYTYDPNTNRMTQYQFTVNGTSLTGALGWNANGTVQTQNITDGFNSADIQNCSYQYDDITRVVSANCGVAAAQTFTFDPFGNISKSGSPYGFNPVYSTSTNRMTALGSFTPTYDNNGNLTNDNIHNYAWDADGRAITVDAGLSDAVSLTYDALGRMVEQNRGGTYTQIAYSPTGDKLATMSGSTLQKAMVPLIGQSQAIYNSSGLLYYAHPDLLGSIRLATTPGRAMYFDTAYAPFGETYAYSGNLDPAYTGQMNDTAHREDVAGGLYDFPLREYSIQGRWPNPDPLGNAATSPGDPQTQNRYAYVRNNPVTYVDPTGGQFCSPEDPECCDPFTDPLCFPFPPPGGGLGGGGGNPEKPRSFPWPLLPPGFFSALEGGGGIVLVAGEANCECTSRSSRPKAPSFFSFACFYSCICDNPKNYDHTPTLFVTFKHLLVQHVKQYGRTCTYCPKTARGKWAYAVEQDTLFPGVNLDTTFYSLLYLTYVSETQ
jgi:RHS repeat-associated protein